MFAHGEAIFFGRRDNVIMGTYDAALRGQYSRRRVTTDNCLKMGFNEET